MLAEIHVDLHIRWRLRCSVLNEKGFSQNSAFVKKVRSAVLGP